MSEELRQEEKKEATVIEAGSDTEAGTMEAVAEQEAVTAVEVSESASIEPTDEVQAMEAGDVAETAESVAAEVEEEAAEAVAEEADEADQEAEEVTAEAVAAEETVEPVAAAVEADKAEAVAEEADETGEEVTVEAEEEPVKVEAEAEEEPTAEEKPKEKRKPKKISLSELKPNSETTGRVVGIADFGAFVDVGAETDGLIHISELSEGRVKKVSDVVSVGQQVDVWIKDVDVDKERISLSMRPKPDYRLRDLKPEMVVEGVVTGIRDYGVFVDIGSETEGLVHVSEMAEGYVNKPSELVSVGEELEVRVKKVDRRRRRISLSMKGLGPMAPPPPAQEETSSMPTAMELAMRRALGDLEEEIDETSEADTEVNVEGASRDELSDVFNRMLRDYHEDQEDEA